MQLYAFVRMCTYVYLFVRICTNLYAFVGFVLLGARPGQVQPFDEELLYMHVVTKNMEIHNYVNDCARMLARNSCTGSCASSLREFLCRVPQLCVFVYICTHLYALLRVRMYLYAFVLSCTCSFVSTRSCTHCTYLYVCVRICTCS